MKLTWYDGGAAAADARGDSARRSSNTTGGVLYVGSKGKLMHETYGDKPRLLPARWPTAGKPPQTLRADHDAATK